MPKFTPGPWITKYNDNDEFKAWEVVGPNKNEWIAECGYGGNAEACANFIAAAPDVYDALVAFLEDYIELVNSGDAGFWNPEDDDCVKIARAALAKAGR